MKKHALRRLRAALASEPCLAIWPQALDQLAAGNWPYARPSSSIAALRRDLLAYDDDEEDEMEDTSPVVSGAIAIVPIVGVLTQRQTWYGMGLEQLETTFQSLARDSKIKAVVPFFDTPGGSAMGTEEVAEAIAGVRAAGKPVVAFVKGMAASAGYYLASQAEKIVATKTSLAGSIGVVIAHMEMADLFREWGIGVNVITYGANKWAANPFQKLSERGRGELQRMVNGFGKLFDAAVARGRGVTPSVVKDKFGQGSVFLAEEAQGLGLIDEIGTLAGVLADLKARLEQPADQNMRSGVDSARRGEASSADSSLRSSIESLASAKPAGTSAAQPPATAGNIKEDHAVSIKIKAALFARGLIQAIDAGDDICKAVLAAWFNAQGKALPTADEEILAAMNGTPAPAGGGKPADNVAAAREKEFAEAKAAAATEAAEKERKRITSLQASGRVLGIDPKLIEQGIATGKSDDAVIAGWVKEKAKSEPPVAGDVRIVGEGADRFMADATTGQLLKIGAKVDPKLVNADTRRLSKAPLIVLAQQCLAMRGVRVDAYAAPEDIAEAALAMDDHGRRNITPDAVTVRPSADDPAFNRPGSFPNLLSNLANKVLDEGLELAMPTYPEWCGRFAGDLPDFKPSPIVNKGVADELDVITDGEALKELGLAEEMLSYIQLGRYGDKFAWTPVLIANDDLNAFQEGLLGLAGAHENTLNRLCASQLTGNVSLLDGFALFDNTNHGNDITGGSGGAPSDVEWNDMEVKVAAQRGVGGTGYVRAPLAIALVPPTHKRAAIQTFSVPSVSVEVKQATTDANVNIYRGMVKVVIEAELQASSTAIWYGLCQPRGTMNATVIYAYFRGWGQGGRRETWYDPNTKCRYVSIEGRFAAAAKQYRTAVRNAGA